MTDDPQGRFNFDINEGCERKEQGIALASAPLSRQQLLELAQEFAAKIARERGEVTADDVWIALLREGLDPSELGPAWGAVFRTGFIFTGRLRSSRRVSNHARANRIWRLA